jgi:hypothetical protein
MVGRKRTVSLQPAQVGEGRQMTAAASVRETFLLLFQDSILLCSKDGLELAVFCLCGKSSGGIIGMNLHT